MQITSAKTLVLAHYVHKGKEHFIYQYFLDLMSELKKDEWFSCVDKAHINL